MILDLIKLTIEFNIKSYNNMYPVVIADQQPV